MKVSDYLWMAGTVLLGASLFFARRERLRETDETWAEAAKVKENA